MVAALSSELDTPALLKTMPRACAPVQAASGPWWDELFRPGALPPDARIRARARSGVPPGRPPARRLAVARWVAAQRRLFVEQRLSRAQLRYMTLLGTNKCLCMSNPLFAPKQPLQYLPVSRLTQ